MKKVLLSDLKSGMITAEDVYSIDGQLIVPKNIALTENLIARIFSFDIFSIKVQDEVLSVASMSESSDAPNPEQASYVEKLKSSPEFQAFKEEFKENVGKLQFSFKKKKKKNTEFDPGTI